MPDYAMERRQVYNIRLLTIWLLYTTFGGAVRKWVFTDALTGNIMLGLQIGMPLLFVLLARTRRFSPFTVTLVGAYSMVLVLMVFNPLAQTVMHGIIGFFLHSAVFLPLLVYLNDRAAFPVERLNRLFVTIALIEVALGFFQFLAPTDSFINKYVRDTTAIGGIAHLPGVNRVRITGTFSYIGGMTSLFTVFGFVVWGMRLTRQSAIWIGTILICCGIVSPMTGSRGLTALLLILISCGFLSTVTEIRNTVGLAFLGLLLLLALPYANVSLVNEAYAGLNGRIQEHMADGENRSRIIGQLEEIIDFKG